MFTCVCRWPWLWVCVVPSLVPVAQRARHKQGCRKHSAQLQPGVSLNPSPPGKGTAPGGDGTGQDKEPTMYREPEGDMLGKMSQGPRSQVEAAATSQPGPTERLCKQLVQLL